MTQNNILHYLDVYVILDLSRELAISVDVSRQYCSLDPAKNTKVLHRV